MDIYVYTAIHIQAAIYAHVIRYMCVYMYLYIYIYMCMYVHAHASRLEHTLAHVLLFSFARRRDPSAALASEV